MIQLLFRTNTPRTSRIRTLESFTLRSSGSKILLTLISCSRNCTKPQFHSFCISPDSQVRSSMQFQCQRFAFCRIICIFHILHSSLISKCCEYTFGKVSLLGFTCKKRFSTQHQKVRIDISQTLKIIYAEC